MNHEIYIEDVRECAELSNDLISLLKETVVKTLEFEKVDQSCYVSITIVDSEEIKDLNREYRSIDKVTDVLSFPVVNLLDDSFTDDVGDYYEGMLILGDVILCADRAREQALDFGHTIEREFGYLTCHSILHLIGYDHEEDDDREIMRQKEEAIMNCLSLKRE